MFCFIGQNVYGILAPWSGFEPTSPEPEGEILTTGLPGKSQKDYVFNISFFFNLQNRKEGPVDLKNSHNLKIESYVFVHIYIYLFDFTES